MPPEPADIGSFQGEVSSQIAGERKVEDVGVGRLQLVVHAPIDGEAAGGVDARGRSNGKRSGNYAAHLLSAVLALRQIVNSCEAESAIDVLNSVGVGFVGGQAEGAVAIEGVDQAFTEVVEVQTVAHADRTLAGATKETLQPAAIERRRVREREARSQVSVIPVPVGL